jgi:hypothetical protein
MDDAIIIMVWCIDDSGSFAAVVDVTVVNVDGVNLVAWCCCIIRMVDE